MDPASVTTVASILPNLGVGVVAIIAMLLIVREFVNRSREKDAEFLAEIKERESAFRAYSEKVQGTLLKQIEQNSRVLSENTQTMERVLEHIKTHRRE